MSSKGHSQVTMPIPRHPRTHCSLYSGVGQGWVPTKLLHEPVGGLHEGFSWSLNPVSSQVKVTQYYLSRKEEPRTKNAKEAAMLRAWPKGGMIQMSVPPSPRWVKVHSQLIS